MVPSIGWSVCAILYVRCRIGRSCIVTIVRWYHRWCECEKIRIRYRKCIRHHHPHHHHTSCRCMVISYMVYCYRLFDRRFDSDSNGVTPASFGEHMYNMLAYGTRMVYGFVKKVRCRLHHSHSRSIRIWCRVIDEWLVSVRSFGRIRKCWCR